MLLSSIRKKTYCIWCLFFHLVFVLLVCLDGGLIGYNSSFLPIIQLLRTRRPFVAEFTDAMGNEIFTVRFSKRLLYI
jgi:hypothetical protein